MKFRIFCKKIMLMSTIGLLGFAVSKGSMKTVDVSAAASEVNSAATGTEQSISDLYPIHIQTENGVRYGYIDGKGQEVIKPVYMDAMNFSEGFAVVYDDDKSQLINQKGKVIFDSEGAIQGVHQGLAAFSDPNNNYKQGYINTEGKVVITPKYDFAGDFHADRTAFVSKSGIFYKINTKGKILKTYQLRTKLNYYDVTDDGYVIVNDPKTFKIGVINLDGKTVLKPVYGQITYLGSGIFGVKKAVSDYEAYSISLKPAALFNKNGKKLTSYKYNDLSEFNGGYASVTDSKYTYFIDKNGKEVSSLPKLEGRGTMKVLGDIIQADIDNEIIYEKKDGTLIWKKAGITKLSTGIIVNTVKIKPNKYVVVNYPKIEGLSDLNIQNEINKQLKSLFVESRKNLKEKDDLMVDDNFTVKQIKDLLIVNQTGYDYPVGAAHGTPLRFYYFINVNTGEFYQLKDLFKNDSDYITLLSKLVYEQMKNNNGDMVYYFDSKDLINKNQYFYINEDKITIYFDCGAISAYAAGFPEFEIPFTDIKNIINTDGPFWKAFHS